MEFYDIFWHSTTKDKMGGSDIIFRDRIANLSHRFEAIHEKKPYSLSDFFSQ